MLYEALVKIKESGKTLDVNTLTREDLIDLWYYGGMPDNMIADLFDVKTSRITNLRNNFGVKGLQIIEELIYKKHEEYNRLLPEDQKITIYEFVDIIKKEKLDLKEL